MTPMTRIEVGEFLAAAAARMQAPDPAPDGALRCGIDLGTATVVLPVVDGRDQPVYLDQRPAEAVRDGVVVDFAGAATAVRQLRERAGEQLGTELTSAATAYPPGISQADARAC